MPILRSAVKITACVVSSYFAFSWTRLVECWSYFAINWTRLVEL